MQLTAMRDYARKRGWKIAIEVKDVGSGASLRQKREELLVLARQRAIDLVVVWRLDRLGRSLGDLIHLTTELRSRGVDFESLTEKIETGSSAGKLIFHVFASLAEFERNLIRERTMAGLRAARARGRNGGRPKKLKTKDIQAIRALMHAGELPVQDIAKRFGVSRSTLYRNAARPESPKVLTGTRYRPVPASEI